MEKKRRVGVTGATGRLATILIRQLKDEYDLKLFSFEKPECTYPRRFSLLGENGQ